MPRKSTAQKSNSQTEKIRSLGKQIFERQGISFSAWREDLLNKRKMAILAGKDPEWENSEVDKELKELVFAEMSKTLSNKPSTVQTERAYPSQTANQNDKTEGN